MKPETEIKYFTYTFSHFDNCAFMPMSLVIYIIHSCPFKWSLIEIHFPYPWNHSFSVLAAYQQWSLYFRVHLNSNSPAFFQKVPKLSESKQKKINKLSSRHLTVWPQPIWIKVRSSWQIPLQHQSTYLGGPKSASIEIPPFRPHFIKFQK